MYNNYFDQVQNTFLEIILYTLNEFTWQVVHISNLFLLIALLLDFCGYSESLCDICTV